VRVVVLCADPGHAAEEPDSAAAVLADLGCRVTTARFDLADLDRKAIARTRPDFVVVDAGDHLHLVLRSREKINDSDVLSRIPALLVVTLPRLPGVDFSAGWDDFVLKPLVPAELYARLRQLDWRMAAFRSEEIVKIDGLVIDVAGHEAHLHGRRIEFTHQEFELLRFLAQNRGRVYTRSELLQTVWGYAYAGSTRTVDIHVRRLRAKLGPACELIETVRGVGYKLRAGASE
jgi:DNA-binding response OmpR family regulator